MSMPDFVALQRLKASDLNTIADNLDEQIAETRYVVKTANESVNSGGTGTTLQNDNELVLSVEANSTYIGECMLLVVVAGNAITEGDIKVAFTFPANATVYLGGLGQNQTTIGVLESAGRAADTSSPTTDMVYGPNSSATPITILIKVVITTGATAGGLQLQWAQNSADAQDTTVLAGSYLMLHKAA